MVVARHREEHLEANDLHDNIQSAYCRGHSILLSLCSEIAEALDEEYLTALIMIELMAVFDVIDHKILLKQSEFSFRIKENAVA